MQFLLDTTVCIAALRGNAKVLGHLSARRPDDFAISLISVFELHSGVYRCRAPEVEARKVEAFLQPFHLLPFDWDSAVKTAEIRFGLEKSGRKIGPYDLQLCGQALVLDLVVVTHNVREFERVEGLRVEDWE